MRTRLSSRLTFFYKMVFAPVGIAGVWAMVGGYIALPEEAPGIGRAGLVLLLCLAVALTAGLFLSCVPLKRVIGEEGVLVVSNYQREVRLPYGSILLVRPRTWQGNGQAILSLAENTTFGRRIRFLLPARLVLVPPYGEHPAIRFLRDKGVTVAQKSRAK